MQKNMYIYIHIHIHIHVDVHEGVIMKCTGILGSWGIWESGTGNRRPHGQNADGTVAAPDFIGERGGGCALL